MKKANRITFSYNVFFLYFYLLSNFVFLLPYVLLIFFLPQSYPAPLNGLSRDSQQLLSFKATIFNRIPLQNWVSSTNPCSFTGITCKGSRVSSIDLTNTMLSVDFSLVSSYLLRLENLESLVLKNTNLSGSLTSATKSQCSDSLSYIDLAENSISGPVSDIHSFGRCNNLNALNLSKNSMDPPGRGDGDGSGAILRLQNLDLSYNNISGQNIFFMLSPSDFPELELLSLKGNKLSGKIPELSFKNLSYLDLSANNFSGNFPTFQDCSTLQHLDLSTNKLSGNIDASLSSCSKLSFLNLTNNKFGGAVAKLPSGTLQYLYLGGNDFQGDLPGHIGDICKTLVELDLSPNNLSGMVPETLGDCSALELLDLSNNNLSGELPVETLLNLTSLKTLVFSFNNFVGGLSESMSSLVNLETLDLSSNNISGLIPSGICKDPKNSLKVLYLQNNFFTGPIPESLSNCSQLESLDLSFNYLKGKIPSSLGSMSKLKDLIFWFNQLEGEIPRELMYLQSLELLILDFNDLSGSIAESLSNCTNLKWISLSNNLLSGAIPASLGRLSNLAILKLGNNSISGNIPAELGNCRSLLWLDLNTNFLKGSIPPALFKQSGNIAMPLLTGKQLVYIRNDRSEQCHDTGNLLEFGGIRLDHLDRISTRNPCNLTRAYKVSSLSTFNHNGSMIFFDLSYNKLEGSIPKELGSMQYLQVLNLRHNDLSGRIPRELGGLEYVGNLDLSHNRLDGSIPQTLTNLTFLSDIDLSNNHLSGMIPNSGQFGTFPEERFANNSGLCGFPLPQCRLESSSSSRPSTLESGSSSKPSRSKKKHFIIIPCAVVAGVALIGLVIMLLVFRRGGERRKDNDEEEEEWSMISFQRLDFSKWEILGSLTDENLIGKGGSGKVYRVTTRQGQIVAVKSIRDEQKQGHNRLEKQFLAEVKILGEIRHYNIVKLLCCIRGKTTKLIVYEYMEKQCLYNWLHGKKKGLTTEVLNWETRLKIGIGAAQGLCYMHHDCNPHIVHRDIKSSNILVDSEFNAKIADFGLAKMLASQRDPETASAVVGTFGYIAPEYGSTRKVNVKSDVYSFGVVLLELTTGREAVTRDEDMNLAQWAHNHQREGNSAVDALDEEIKDPHYGEAATTVFKLGLVCTLSSPSRRPSMKDILQILQGCSEISRLFSQR